MPDSVEQLVRQIHDAPGQFVLAASGGGSRAIADLLEVPGASRTVLEAIVPYAEPSMIAWLGGRPDQFCSPQTARAMAVAAFDRARKYGVADSLAAGLACTAGLATDRPKRGSHRVYIALQTAARTATWSLKLSKGYRTRAEEELLVSRLVLNAAADACGLSSRLELPLVAEEQVQSEEALAKPAWQELFLGKVEAVREGGPEVSELTKARPMALLPGAFNPLHAAHRRMVEIGQDVLGVSVAIELSILNVDKPPLDYDEIARRIKQFPSDQSIWLTRAATFAQKSRLFPGVTFLVGADTLRRIALAQYYRGDPAAFLGALEEIASRGNRFLVFGRDMGTGFVRLSDLDLPPTLAALCREIPPDRFREDISSTAIRRSNSW